MNRVTKVALVAACAATAILPCTINAQENDAAQNLKIESFFGYKFGDQGKPGDTKYERPKKNFRLFDRVELGYTFKVGLLNQVKLTYCAKAESFKSQEMLDEIEAVKGVLEKKYGITFKGGRSKKFNGVKVSYWFKNDHCCIDLDGCQPFGGNTSMELQVLSLDAYAMEQEKLDAAKKARNAGDGGADLL